MIRKMLLVLAAASACILGGMRDAEARGRGEGAAAAAIGALIIGGIAAAAAAQTPATQPRRVARKKAPPRQRAATIKAQSGAGATARASDPFAGVRPARAATVPVRQ